MIQDFEELKKYLDRAIQSWRMHNRAAELEHDKIISSCYIDAFQSVRFSVFDELLPPEGSAK